MLFVILRILITGLCLWLTMRLITNVESKLGLMIGIAAVSEVVAIFPIVGPTLSWVAILILLTKLTDAELWPDALLTVLISGVISLALQYGLHSMLDSVTITMSPVSRQ